MPGTKRIPSFVGALMVLMAYALWPGESRATTTSPGQLVRREFGPLAVDLTVGEIYARVTIRLTLGKQFVGEGTLSLDTPEYRFAVISGLDTARGTLVLHLDRPPLPSNVSGDLTVMNGNKPPYAFLGELATWIAPESWIYAEATFPLTPELSAVTTVRGFDRTMVETTLLDGSMTMYAISVNQASPLAVIPDSLVLGSAGVAAGARFSMTIPTKAQPGSLLMQAVVQSRNIPPTPISSVIAIWH